MINAKQAYKKISTFERAYQTTKAGKMPGNELYDPEGALVNALGVELDDGFRDFADAKQFDLFFNLQRAAKIATFTHPDSIFLTCAQKLMRKRDAAQWAGLFD